MPKEVLLKPVVIILAEKHEASGSGFEKRVLMQQRMKESERDGPYWGCWEFPQGKMRLGESLFVAAARELKEESGLDLVELKMPSESVLTEHMGFPVESFTPQGLPLVIAYQFIGIPIIAEVEGDWMDTEEARNHCWVNKTEAMRLMEQDQVFTLDGPVLDRYFSL